MPPEKVKKSKEQTWKEDELQESLKQINDGRSQGKSRSKHGEDSKASKDSSHRKSVENSSRKDREDGGRERRRREDGDSGRKHRDDRDRRHKDDRDKDYRREKDDDREKRHYESDGKDRKHKDDRDRRRGEGDGRRHSRERRHDDRERRHRDGDDRERRHKDRDDIERRHRDGDDEEKRRRGRDDRDERHREERDRRRRDDGRERRHRDEKDKRHRDDDKDRRHRDDKDRRHRDDSRDRRHRDEDKDRRHRDDDKDRRHRDEDRRDRRSKEDSYKERRHRDEGENDQRREESDNRDAKGRGDKDRKHRDGEDRERKHGDREDTERRNRDNRDRGDKDSDNKERRRRGDDGDKHREDRDRKQHYDREKRNNGDYKDKRSREDDKNSKTKEHSSDRDRQRHKDNADSSEENVGAKSHKDHRPGRIKHEDDVAVLKETKKQDTKEEEEEEDEYGGYDDDDFEDYDEDFEDDDGADDDNEQFRDMTSLDGMAVQQMTNNDMEELFDALNAENERLLASSRKSFNSDDTEGSDEKMYRKPAANKPRSFINFVAAKQRDMNQKAASKARKRCTELLSIVELDTVHMTLFDLPPVKEYDLYMSSFGRTNAQQVYIQTNDDNLDRDTQTEDIDTFNRWTQHPAEGATACGLADSQGQETEDTIPNSKHDEGKLASFLQRACQVVERLINEEHAKSSYTEKSASFSSSEGYVSLRNVQIFNSRRVSNCHFSPSDSAMLLTMHTEPTEPVDKRLDKYGLIGVWNTNDPSQPQKIVASASMPTCCCFSPIKATLVFGGMRDGSLVAWDLREPPTMHHSYICGGQDWLLRFPTYNTAGVLQYDNHNSPITALVPLLTDSGKSVTQDSGSGLSFQLATLERNGVVNLWVVAEILETSMAGSESDLGLSPNGKIKLLKSSSISLIGTTKIDVNQTLCTLDLKLNPTNHNHFYVATDSGMVLHRTRFGTQKTIPRCYKCADTTPCVISTVDLHPFGHPVLLAGCEDGSLRLHHLSTESPIIVWESSTNGSAIRRVLWSRSCSYIIFVLDSNSIIHMWDLLRNDAEPMASEQVSDANSKAIDMCLSDEGQSHSRPKMVVTYDDGRVQVHLLSSHVSNLQPGENEQFSRFVEHL